MKLTDMLKGVMPKTGGNDEIAQTGKAKETTKAEGVHAQVVQNAAPSEGLAKTASADLAEKVKTSLATVAQIKPKFDQGSGEVAHLVTSAIDFSEAQAAWWATPEGKSQPGESEIMLGKIKTAVQQLSGQLETAAGEGHHGKAKSEVAERQVYAKAFAGQLTQRILEDLPLDVAFRAIPDLPSALAPVNADQKQALAFIAQHAGTGRKAEQGLSFLGRAVKEGFELDMGEKKAAQGAESAIATDPDAALAALKPIIARAEKFLAGEEQDGGFEPIQSWGGSEQMSVSGDDEKQISDNMKAAQAKLDAFKETLPGTEVNTKDRMLGCLMGAAVGDCLGAHMEFKGQFEIRMKVGMVTDLIGGGPFGFAPGEYTDDTQMAAGMARSIAAKGKFDADDTAKHWVKWKQSKPKDIGGLTRQALGTKEAGASAKVAGFIPWATGGYDNAGNGSVMRAAPIAMLTAFDTPEAIMDAAVKSSEVTHFDPRCTWGTAAISLGVSLLMKGEDNVTQKVAKMLEDKSPAVAKCLKDVSSMTQEDLKTTGYVIDTIQAAFWCLENTDNYVDGAAIAANNGDDTDTVGATAGILLGAKYGLSGIPEGWAKKVKGGDELKSLAAKIHDIAS